MRKQRILSAIAAIFSVFIVCGGWLLTNALMDRQQFNLINTVRSVKVKESPEDNQDGEADRIILSTKEIADILKVWRNEKTGYYHDPVEGQLTMEEAIKAASSGLYYFCNKGVLPSQILEGDFNQTNAFLYDIQTTPTREGVEPAPRPAYSFWSVSLANQKIIVDLTLNAQTGQIWMANITSTSDEINLNKISAIDLLQKYESYLSLSNGNHIESNENYAASSYYNDLIGLVVYKKTSDYGNYNMIQFAIASTQK